MHTLFFRSTKRTCLAVTTLVAGALWLVPGTFGVAFANHPAAKLAMAPVALFASLPADEQKQLLNGKRLVKLHYRMNDKRKKSVVAQARGVIKRPPAEVYKYLSQIEKVQEFMPNLIHSKIQRKLAPNKYEMLRIIKVMWTKINMHLTVELTPTSRLTWQLIRDKKNGIKDTVGSMNLEGIQGGKATLLTYIVYTDTGRAIPGFIRNMLVRKSLPNVIKALEKRVMSHGRWKK